MVIVEALVAVQQYTPEVKSAAADIFNMGMKDHMFALTVGTLCRSVCPPLLVAGGVLSYLGIKNYLNKASQAMQAFDL